MEGRGRLCLLAAHAGLRGWLLVGFGCVFVARPLLEMRRVRWVVTALLFLFASGAGVCDLIWYAEGGSRGTSWRWGAPVLGLFASTFARLVLLLDLPLQLWREWRTGIAGALCVAAIGFVASLPRGQRRIGAALALAGALLVVLVRAWANFVAD